MEIVVVILTLIFLRSIIRTSLKITVRTISFMFRFLFRILIAVTSTGSCAERVNARRLRAIDGDTVWLVDHNGRIIEKFRLLGMNAPETRGFRAIFEGRRGERAKKNMRSILSAGQTAEIHRRGKDVYGRTLAHITVDGTDIARTMLRRGHARPA